MITSTATTTIMDLINSASSHASGTVGLFTNQASQGAHSLWFGFLGINWQQPTWDIIILIFFVVTVFIYGFALGRDRVVAILVSTYLALAVATNMPYINLVSDWLNSTLKFAFQISAFLFVFIVLLIFLSRSSLIQGISNLSGGLLQTLTFALLLVGLLISIVLSFLPLVAVEQLSEFTKFIFISDLGRFTWIILPVVGLVLFRGRDDL